jgi:hypothetical protein
MRKITLILTAVVVALGAMTLHASAQNQQHTASIILALRGAPPPNATPIVTLAACNGTTGHCGCGPGWVSACGNTCCGCRRCQ